MNEKTGWMGGGLYRLPSGAVVKADAYGIINPALYPENVLTEWDAIADAEENG